jgi:hydrogenase nickel incorporation protein HypA/HybF
VEPEALALAFDVVMAGTPAAGARLAIEPVAAECFCAGCQAPFPAQDGVCECPRCGAISRRLLRGRELQLAALELADPEDC